MRAHPFISATLILGGCHSPTPATNEAAASRPATPVAAPVAAAPAPADRYQAATSVPCALGDAPLDERCGVEQATTPNGEVLTLRRPDGGFRRLRIADDGRGVVAADGALPARVTIVAPESIEVAVANERYRLPATIRPRDAARP